MNNKRKIVLYTGSAAGLLIIIFIVMFLINNQVTREIPKISDNGVLADPVKEQISKAFLKARFNPSANNLGKLGMVYHSSANYNEAAKCYQLASQRSEEDWLWNYYNGYLNMEMGNSDDVIENFKKVSEKNPDVQLTS